MNNNKCFLSNKTDCELTEVLINGTTYHVDENLTEEHSLKKLKEMILEKINEESAKKEKAMDDLTAAVAALGISKEELGMMLLGKKAQEPAAQEPATQESQVESTAVIKPTTKPQSKDEGFVEVDGTLKSKSMNVNAEEGIGGTMPAYTNVNDKEGKKIIETNKKVKRLDDGGIVEKSDMGTTIIRVQGQDPGLDKMLQQIDPDTGELIRAAVSGSGKASGRQTVECTLCGGSGITKIGHKTCPKCNGTGIIHV